MSDDDYSGADASLGGTTSAGAKQRKGPRFSWTPAYERTFFQSLCESVQLGLKDNHSFKSEAWDRAATALQKQHGAYPNKGHLINKSDNARKKFRLWRGVREDPNLMYNPTSHIVTGTEEAWRKHIEKEPLSRTLKGRPFEHEDYMEVLFPDVIGSGGAPKRITRQRRKDTSALTLSEDQDTPGTTILELLNDNPYVPASLPHHQPQPPTQLQLPQQQAKQQAKGHGKGQAKGRAKQQGTAGPSRRGQSATTAAINAAGAPLVQHRPISNSIPPRTAITSTSALTPPDENSTHTRKRLVPDPPAPLLPTKRQRAAAVQTAYIDPNHPAQQAGVNARPPATLAAPAATTSTTGISATTATTATTVAAAAAATAAVAAVATAPGAMPHSVVENILVHLAEVVKSARQPRWTEQAMDIFFRDFSDEDMDLQVKIAEKALTDTNKAFMFCKMTPELRHHWVKRLREAHNRIGLGS